MSDIPSEIRVTATLPADCCLEKILRLAAERSGVTIINVFQNPGSVVIADQSARPGVSTNHIGTTEIMNEKTHIEATGSVVNYKSTLNNVDIMLNSPASQQSAEDDKVRELLKEFSAKLSKAEAKYSEEVELLSRRLEELTQRATKPAGERKKGLLEMSANGLKDAAIAVGEIVPGLIFTAEKIAEAIRSWSA